eukprot:GHVU01169451.1.p1 GENE.GHVU01169451.1~~GHVU01169451.1.p1  ORF type:complete len:424 (-),score=39.78 GHVU01169451.1:1062-2306(-)
MEAALIPREVPWNTTPMYSESDEAYFKSKFPNYTPVLPRVRKRIAKIERMWSFSPQIEAERGLDNDLSKGFKILSAISNTFLVDDVLQKLLPRALQGEWADRLAKLMMTRDKGVRQEFSGSSNITTQELVRSIQDIPSQNMPACLYRFLFKPSSMCVDVAKQQLASALRPLNLAPTPGLAETSDASVITQETERQARAASDAASHLSYDDWEVLNPRLGDRQTLSPLISALRGESRSTFVVGVHHRTAGSKVEQGNVVERVPVAAVPLLIDCAFRVAEGRGYHRNDTFIFYFSDSDEAKKNAKDLFPGQVLVVNEHPHHLDRKILGDNKEAPDPTTAVVHTVAEILLLAKSDAAVLSDSGFGAVATSLGMMLSSDIVEIPRDMPFMEYPYNNTFCRTIYRPDVDKKRHYGVSAR